jgi:hypothetical protein
MPTTLTTVPITPKSMVSSEESPAIEMDVVVKAAAGDIDGEEQMMPSWV